MERAEPCPGIRSPAGYAADWKGGSPIHYINAEEVLPKHLLETVQAMIADPEVVAAVKAGKAGFRCRKYETRDGNEGLSVEWVDL